MPHGPLYRLAGTALLTLALSTAGLAAGCTPDPASPLPGDTGSSAPARSALPSSATPSVAVPSPSSARTTAAPLPSCLGAVVYTLDGADSADTPSSLCFRVGATLRVENIGPGVLTTEPADIASCHYEAGVVQCRFPRVGTVTVKITPSRATIVRIIA